MDPELIRRRQAIWDAYAERRGVRGALRRFGPRPELPVEGQQASQFSLRETLGDVAEQGVRGVADTGLATASGLAGIGGQLGLEPLRAAAEKLQATRTRIAEAHPADTGAGKVAHGVTRIGSEIGASLLPGAILGKVSKVGALGKLAADAGVEAAIEAGQTPEGSLAGFMGLEKSSQTPIGRALTGGLAAGTFGAVGHGITATRANRARRVLELEQGAAEADELLAKLPQGRTRRGSQPERYSDLPEQAPGDSEVLLTGQLPEGQFTDAAGNLKAGGFDPKAADPMLPVEGFRRLEDLQAALDSTARRRTKLQRRLAARAPGDAEYTNLSQELGRTELAFNKLVADRLAGASRAGQELAKHKYMAGYLKSELDVYAYARRELGDLTSGQMQEMKQFLKGQNGKLAIDTAGLGRWIEKQKTPLSWGDWEFYTTLVRSGMLSAIYSPLRSGLGNLASLGATAAGAPARALSDSFLRFWVRKWSGKEDLAERTFTFRGKLAGAVDIPGDVQESLGYLKTGRGTKDLLDADLTAQASLEKIEHVGRPMESGIEIPKFVPGVGGKDVAEVWTQLWFRLQGAMDTPLRRTIARASLERQADELMEQMGKATDKASVLMRHGLSRGKATKTLSEAGGNLRDALIQAPTPSMQARAIEEAQWVAFQGDTALNTMLQNARGGLTRKGHNVPRALMDLTVPFSRTPSAIAARTVAASPLGLVADFADLVKLAKLAKGATKSDPATLNQLFDVQKKLARRVGDQSVMTGAAMLIGMDLQKQGVLTGPMPDDPQERTRFMREGKIPYAILVGDRWYSLAQMPPFGHVLAMGGELQRTISEVEIAQARGERETGVGALDAAGAIGSAGVDVIAETPFAQGVQRVTEFLDAPGGLAGQAKTAVASTVASGVPNLLASIARAKDPVKDVRRDELATSVRDAVLSRLPFFQNELPDRVDRTLGNPVMREDSTKARIASLVDPTGSSPDRTQRDPLVAELARSGTAPSDPRKLAGEDNFTMRDRLANESGLVRQTLSAFLGQEATPIGRRLLARSGIDRRLIVEYRQLKNMPQTPEVQAAQQEILKEVIERARRFISTTRSRPRGPERLAAMAGA